MTATATPEVRGMGDFTLLIPAVWKGTKYAAPSPPSAAEQAAHLAAKRDAQPSSVTCGFCDWPGVTGTAGECRAAALAHRTAKHPAARPPRRAEAKGPKPQYVQTREDQARGRVRGSRANAEKAA